MIMQSGATQEIMKKHIMKACPSASSLGMYDFSWNSWYRGNERRDVAFGIPTWPTSINAYVYDPKGYTRPHDEDSDTLECTLY